MNTIFNAVIEPRLIKHRAEQSYKEATDPNRVSVLAPDRKRVRALQQAETLRRAAEAEEERKKKVKVELERKRVKSPEEERWEKLGGEGKKIGGEGIRLGIII